MKYSEVLGMTKTALTNNWDPSAFEHDGEYRNKNLDTDLNESIKKHYARVLAAALKRAKLKGNPLSLIKPRVGYMVTSAPNVNPEVLGKLEEEDQRRLKGWDSFGRNISPGLIADAVDVYNQRDGGYVPIELERSPDGKTKYGPRLGLFANDKRVL